MMRRTLGGSVLVVAALLFAPGYLTSASADVVNLYNLNVTLNGPSIFTDTFSKSQVLAGGGLPGKVLPSGINFPDGSSADYAVIGTVTETGASPTLLNTAQGALIASRRRGFTR